MYRKQKPLTFEEYESQGQQVAEDKKYILDRYPWVKEEGRKSPPNPKEGFNRLGEVISKLNRIRNELNGMIKEQPAFFENTVASLEGLNSLIDGLEQDKQKQGNAQKIVGTLYSLSRGKRAIVESVPNAPSKYGAIFCDLKRMWIEKGGAITYGEIGCFFRFINLLTGIKESTIKDHFRAGRHKNERAPEIARGDMEVCLLTLHRFEPKSWPNDDGSTTE